MSELLVTLHNIGKAYNNGTVALQAFNLALKTHEFVSLLGPSGCGKSTALRLIANLISPTSGALDWQGRTAKAEISFVFQEPTLMPWAKVTANVALPLQLKGASSWKKSQNSGDLPVKSALFAPQVLDALEMVGLKDFTNVYPRELSGGMKMRVSVARALVTHPQLLLMDEPFAALDEMTRAKLNDDVLRLWLTQKFSVLFVTHSVYEAVYLSNRILVMAARPGRVIDEIVVDEPFPRNQSFRTTQRYNALCVRVSQALQQAGEHLG